MQDFLKRMANEARKVQERLMTTEKELEEVEVVGKSGGGKVKVVLSGNYEPVEVSVDESVLKMEDREMFEDLLLVALKDALEKVKELRREKLGEFESFGGLL